MLPGSSSTGATTSARPASIALRGMPSNLADVGACTNAAPAFSLIARSPSVPSEPMPEGSRRCCAPAGPRRASERRSRWAGSGPAATPAAQVQLAVQDRHVLVRRDDVDVIGLDRAADPWPETGIRVARWSSSTSIPLCVGSRCWTTTKAMPAVAGARASGTARAPPARRRRRRCRRRETAPVPPPRTHGRPPGLPRDGRLGARLGAFARSSRLLRARATPSRSCAPGVGHTPTFSSALFVPLPRRRFACLVNAPPRGSNQFVHRCVRWTVWVRCLTRSSQWGARILAGRRRRPIRRCPWRSRRRP